MANILDSIWRCIMYLIFYLFLFCVFGNKIDIACESVGQKLSQSLEDDYHHHVFLGRITSDKQNSHRWARLQPYSAMHDSHSWSRLHSNMSMVSEGDLPFLGCIHINSGGLQVVLENASLSNWFDCSEKLRLWWNETRLRHTVVNHVTNDQTWKSVIRRCESPVQLTGNLTASIAATIKF